MIDTLIQLFNGLNEGPMELRIAYGVLLLIIALILIVIVRYTKEVLLSIAGAIIGWLLGSVAGVLLGSALWWLMRGADLLFNSYHSPDVYGLVEAQNMFSWVCRVIFAIIGVMIALVALDPEPTTETTQATAAEPVSQTASTDTAALPAQADEAGSENLILDA